MTTDSTTVVVPASTLAMPTMARLWIQSLWTVYAPGASARVLRRRMTVAAVGCGCLTAASTWWALRHEPGGGPGVETSILITSIALTGCLLACVTEFAMIERPRFVQWLRLQPVDDRVAQILARAPALTLVFSLQLVLVVPLTITVQRSLGGPTLGSLAASVLVLVLGPTVAPLLIWCAQRLVLRFSAGGAYGGAIIAVWFLWAGLSGLALRTIFSRGLDAGIPAWTYALGWPVTMDAAVFGGWRWLSATGVACVFVWLGSQATMHLRSFADVAQLSRLRHQFSFSRAPLLTCGMVRGWRARRCRAYLIAGIVFLTIYCLWRAASRAEAAGETAAMVLALFLAGYATVRRGLSGRNMLEVRLMATPVSWSIAHILGTWLVAFVPAAAGGLVLALVDQRPTLFTVTVAMAWFAVNLGLLLGALLVPERGDATSEMIASIGVLAALGAAGNAISSLFGNEIIPYIMVLAATGTLFAGVALGADQQRWAKLVADTGSES